MYETKNQTLISKARFIKRILRNLSLGIGLLFLSLFVGMFGYIYFEKMSWIDAYLNAAMILSGMGEVGTLNTESGKIFAGTYALFSGVIFLLIIAIIFTPLFHRFIHRFHLEEEKSK